MATVAVGDIHGNLDALDDLLSKLRPILTPSDTLVFLGDYIDRGPNTRGCIDRLLRLPKECPCPMVTLLGNHEDWMLRSLRDATRHSWIMGMEWLDTVASYSVEAARRLRREYENAGPRLLTERVRLPYEIFFDLLPVEHLQFFQSLQLYHLAPEVLCAHGGVDPTGDLAVDPEVFLWGSDDFPQEYCGRLPVVYGHWNNGVRDERGWPRPCVKANKTYGIDTIAHGVLTAVRFPDLQIFQSRRFPSAVRGG